MKRYRVATLGAGQRGKDHARAFAASPDRFELLGWCDRDMPRLRAAVEETGIEIPLFDNVDKMLAELKPDIFCFATPLPIRQELIETGVRHGVKAIVYEKPMASSLAEAQRICALCDRAGVKQINCHQHKFGAHWQKVKEIVDSDTIGEVVNFHATARGWYMHYITHLVDYTMYLIRAGTRALGGTGP
jgi:predicted dehydrogenase